VSYGQNVSCESVGDQLVYSNRPSRHELSHVHGTPGEDIPTLLSHVGLS